MDLSSFGLDLLVGIDNKSIYFLISVGCTVLLGIPWILNFEYSILFLIGAYIGSSLLGLLPGMSGAFWIAILYATVAVGLLAIFMEVFLLRPK